jgi:hypothetical protein
MKVAGFGGYHRREKRWRVLGISKIQRFDRNMVALDILPDVADTKNAKLVINTSVNFEDIDCPIQLGALEFD